jgi:hypothetical protein
MTVHTSNPSAFKAMLAWLQPRISSSEGVEVTDVSFRDMYRLGERLVEAIETEKACRAADKHQWASARQQVERLALEYLAAVTRWRETFTDCDID